MSQTDEPLVPGFEMRPESQALYAYLGQRAPGELVPYDAIAAIVRTDPQTKKGHELVYRVRKRLMRHRQMLFEPVPGVGLKHCQSGEVVDVSDNALRKTRRAASLVVSKLGCARFDELTAEEKVRHNTNVSAIGAIRLFSQPTTLARIRDQVTDAANTIEAGDLALIFQRRTTQTAA